LMVIAPRLGMVSRCHRLQPCARAAVPTKVAEVPQEVPEARPDRTGGAWGDPAGRCRV
jgi:hypothetical protein